MHAFGHFLIHHLYHYNEIPKPGFHNQELVPADFQKLLLSHLGARKQRSSHESNQEYYIGLSKHIYEIRIPFQISNCYIEVFDAFNIFLVYRVYETWILLRFFVSCTHHVAFDWLKSHTPFPGPSWYNKRYRI